MIVKNKKIINILKILTLLSIVSIYFINKNKLKQATGVSYKEIELINPHYIISEETFLNPNLAVLEQGTQPFNALILSIKNHLAPSNKKTDIKIIIDSNGGYVHTGYQLIKVLNNFKKQNNLNLKCYIKNASSMAFTVVLGVCDEKIALKNIKLLQHPIRIAFGNQYYETLNTRILNLKKAQFEANILKIEYKKWLKITNKEKSFSIPEMFKYKLINKFYDYQKGE